MFLSMLMKVRYAIMHPYRRTLFKCVVKCLRFRGKREIASLIFAFARGFTWFASGSLIYCVLLNAIVEKTRNSQLLDSRI